MPEAKSIIGAPCWVDLMTSDVSGARKFYGELLGWDAEEAQEKFGGYFNFTKDGGRMAGCMPKMQADLPDVWSVYLTTEDAKQTVDAAVAKGSQVLVEPMAVVTDPTGAAIGMWKPAEHQGFAKVGEPGTPGWFELHSRNYAECVAFYR